MTAISHHRLLLAAGAVLAVGSGVWFTVLDRSASRQGRTTVRPVTLSSTAYAPVGRDAPAVRSEAWDSPPPQTRGRDWVYDVFTPPEIFYDARTKQFSIAPPAPEPVAEAPTEAPFGLALAEVRRVPFRLQLVGYVGGEGNYRGLFENVVTGETFLATGGRSLPALALRIESLAVTRQPVATEESSPVNRPVATAVVRDERTGRQITLTNLERYYPDAPLALVRLGDEPPREVREGDEVRADDAVFHIDRIQLAPPTLEVTKAATGATVTRTLTPEAIPVPPKS